MRGRMVGDRYEVDLEHLEAERARRRAARTLYEADDGALHAALRSRISNATPGAPLVSDGPDLLAYVKESMAAKREATRALNMPPPDEEGPAGGAALGLAIARPGVPVGYRPTRLDVPAGVLLARARASRRR